MPTRALSPEPYMTRAQVQSWCPRPIDDDLVDEFNHRLPTYVQNMYRHAVEIQKYLGAPVLGKEHLPQLVDVCQEAPWTRTIDVPRFHALLGSEEPICAEDFLPALQEQVERALSALLEILGERVFQKGKGTVRKDDFVAIFDEACTVETLRTPEELEKIRRKYAKDPEELNHMKPPKVPLITLIGRYNKMKMPELKALLKERKLPTSGKKADLVQRLANDGA